jgi:hypothetical protein
MTVLDDAASRQAVWSATASALKSRHDRARLTILMFSSLGALLAAVASQLPDGNARLVIAVLSSVLLASVTFLTSRILSAGSISSWTRARAAAEALKRAAYKYSCSCQPYHDPATRDSLLNQERQRIEADVDDLSLLVVPACGPGSCPRVVISRAEYVASRLDGQISTYFEDRAERARRAIALYGGIEISLAFCATALTAVVGVAGKQPFGLPFDFIALTAVITTIGGAVLAHMEASKYAFIVTLYRATARRLRDLRSDGISLSWDTPQAWSEFVIRCEDILEQENQSWVSKWSKPAGSP